MQFAHDYNDKRVHISETVSNQSYYCPFCGAPLDVRKGEIYQHCFAHKRNKSCKDTWVNERSYNTSLWHNEWQSLFPKINQEVKLSLGDTTHRADILTDRTVIEFQHSNMPNKAFDDRNNFYSNLGYKVVWLFDLSDLYGDKLIYEREENGLTFKWKNPKRAFNNHDIAYGNIDLFFQIDMESELCIVRVLDVSDKGFEEFYTTELMSKEDFLNFVGLKDGTCLPPCKDYLEDNEKYRLFKEKYNINLNKQQERAMLAVEGSNLLLAVPGSGKTTVLIARLGHMIINKNIPPENILAITYNKSAEEELRERFIEKFGAALGNRIEFRTINSLCFHIYKDYYVKRKKKNERYLIEEKEKTRIISEIYRKYNKVSASEYEIIELSTLISYIKNMMLEKEQIIELEASCENLYEMYEDYDSKLREKNLMDFDDQMRYANWVLDYDENILKELRNKYKYICVDEAQDTSKIQHIIIKKLADKNLFMVGDEDQSIYGFRAAYPKALLNFRYDYTNPYILQMEKNYRSKTQIVELAQKFISQNKGRYKKNMIAERGLGKDVYLENVNSREEQFNKLLEVAKEVTSDTAFLYRDNECAIVLVDLLMRNNIEFNLQKPVMNYFGSNVVMDVVAYLSLAMNKNVISSFKQINRKGIIYFPSKQSGYAMNNCKDDWNELYSALSKQIIKFLDKKEYRKKRLNKFNMVIKKISHVTSLEAISIILNNGYRNYLEEKHLDMGKIEILKMLAKKEPNINKFMNRLLLLKNALSKDISSPSSKLTLSTIHSSKGMEYENVYLVDVYDGRFPSSIPNLYYRSKDSDDGEQEERRLFYVGITRAKDYLHLFRIKDKPSMFIDSLFPKQINDVINRKEISDKVLKHFKSSFKEKRESVHKPIEKAVPKINKEIIDKNVIIQIEKEQLAKGYNEVNDKFDQQDIAVYDSFGKRWVKCEVCHMIKRADEFIRYGGLNRETVGECRECNRKNRI